MVLLWTGRRRSVNVYRASPHFLLPLEQYSAECINSATVCVHVFKSFLWSYLIVVKIKSCQRDRKWLVCSRNSNAQRWRGVWGAGEDF